MKNNGNNVINHSTMRNDTIRSFSYPLETDNRKCSTTNNETVVTTSENQYWQNYCSQLLAQFNQLVIMICHYHLNIGKMTNFSELKLR